jgi:hypothetical protein
MRSKEAHAAQLLPFVRASLVNDVDPNEARTPSASTSLPTWLGLGLPLLLALAWKSSELLLPPHGEHAWRDADGIGVARSFLHDSWNLLMPRVAERGATPGVVGMELPLVNWLSAALMRLFGESYFVTRLPVWLSIPPLLFAGLALARRMLRDERSARIAAACLVLQPLVLVFSRKLMPEVPMLALLCVGAAWSYDGIWFGSWTKALAGGLALALAALLKPTGFAVAVPVAWWLLRREGLKNQGRDDLARSSSQSRKSSSWASDEEKAPLRSGCEASPWERGGVRSARGGVLVVAPPLIAVVLWFAHARSLDEQFGLPLFKLHHDWLEWTHLLFQPNFLAVVFGRVLHLYLLWPTVIWMVWRWRITLEVLREHRDLLAWIVAALFGVVLFGSHNFQHAYYALPLLPPLCLWVGAFVARATSLQKRPIAWEAAFLVVFAITALIRTVPRFPPLGFDSNRVEAAMSQFTPGELTVATDERTPVVSLVVLRRNGWSLPASTLSVERIRELHQQGAKWLVESSFGGWLDEGVRASLPLPSYQDDQLRIYRLVP